MGQIHFEVSVEDSPIALLYDRHAQSILVYLSRFALSDEDIDDLTLEVFIAAMERQVWISWNHGEQLAWLRRIAHNKAVDFFRRARHRTAIPLENIAPRLHEDDRRAPEARALRDEDAMVLRTHIAQLSELQQEIIRLRFGQGMSSKEIARQLNKSDSVVRVSLSRALQYLRKIYQSQEGE